MSKSLVKRAQVKKVDANEKAHSTSLLKRLGAGAAVLATILGIVTGLTWFLSKVDITVGPESKLNPFRTPFIVKNSGNIPLRVVIPSCFIKRAEYGHQQDFSRNSWTDLTRAVHVLKPNEATTEVCSLPIRTDEKPLHLDVTIGATYQLPLIPFARFSFQARFVSTEIDEETHWIPAAIDP